MKDEYPQAVRERAERMRRARARRGGTWRALAHVGALGFVFVLPVLALIALGRWVELRFGIAGPTLFGLGLGLLLGGALAWREIRRGLSDDDMEEGG